MQASRIFTVAIVAALVSISHADIRESARQLAKEHSDSIVWLSVLTQTSMGAEGDVPAQIKAALASQDKEERDEVTATVIDSSGMLVTALGGLDKSSVVDGQRIQTPMGDIKVTAKSEIKEIKVIMPDGSEIPADLVLKDEDLGLAFVKVRSESDEAQGIEFQAVNLEESTPASLLDPCVSLTRMDDTFNRESGAMIGEIIGVTQRPRVFYRINSDAIGCPVFLENGKILGITVLKQKKGGTAVGGRIEIAPAVLPASDIAKIAAQAMEAEPIAAEEEAVDATEDEGDE